MRTASPSTPARQFGAHLRRCLRYPIGLRLPTWAARWSATAVFAVVFWRWAVGDASGVALLAGTAGALALAALAEKR